MSQKTDLQSDNNGDAAIAAIKTTRENLESRISQAHATQLDLISSLHSLLPSLSLSLNIPHTFNPNHRQPFIPTPNPNPNPSRKRPPPLNPETRLVIKPREREKNVVDDGGSGSGSGSPLLIVRSMVAVCLIERVPFAPIDSSTVLRKLENDQNATTADKAALREVGGESGAILAVEMALQSMAEDNGGVELEEFVVGGKSRVLVMGIDRTRLMKELPESRQNEGLNERGKGQQVGPSGLVKPVGDMWMGPGLMMSPGPMMGPRGGPRMMMIGSRGMGAAPMHRPMMGGPSAITMKPRTEEDDLKDLEALLNKKSFKELQKSKTGEELLDLIRRPTAKETAVAAKFKSKGGSQVKEYCTALTKEDCRRQTGSFIACEKVHFRRIIALHTDMNLGDCSFLDTCRHMKTCKYVHYELDNSHDVTPMMMGPGALGPPRPLKPQRAEYCSEVELGEPQWINCDIRNFRMDILGQFGVIMADPPWDIHMELPYGTMADDEMRTLNVPALQTDGLIFLWVTGRAMELGRECLELWGYKRCEEIIWVKTNQLQRIIRTGRTGHWLNHSKEHCLVGIKGDPLVNRNIDTDVLVAEVRETSRKPDEMYPLLERISPRTRKLELFARMHNTQAGWMSLGNQLSGVRLVDEGLRARFKAAYPDVEIQPASPPRVSTMDIDNNNNNNAAQTKSPFAGAELKTTLAEQRPLNPEIEMTS